MFLVSPHSQPYMRSSPRFLPKHALQTAVESKHTEYGNLCRELNMHLHPIAFDILGTVGPGTELGLGVLPNILLRESRTNLRVDTVKLFHTSALVLQSIAVSVNRRLLTITSPT